MSNKKLKAFLIYPHQLFEKNIYLSADKIVFIIEDALYFTQYKFHKQKLILHRASMKQYQDTLEKKGFKVIYIESHSINKTKDIADILFHNKITSVELFDPVDNWLDKKLKAGLLEKGIVATIYDSPQFITNQQELDSFFTARNGPRRYFMKDFYIWQRKRLRVLVDTENKPLGGAWSYDEDNRKKIPKNEPVPADPNPISNNTFVYEAKKYIEKYFPLNYGNTGAFFYPTSHIEAKSWLSEFLVTKLSNFGPYEDAITTRGSTLYHSVLSPLINIGLLTPAYVLEQTLSHAKDISVPMSSLEGFIRQIIGWREYMRAVYIYEGTTIRNKNYFNSSRTLPKSFWVGTTGIEPIDDTIRTALKYAYGHHIPRLMVMGNFMNLCGFMPNHVHTWFMEMYIDAYDWVMVPNVYSMALYADGGIITTKPYISGSNYVLKMSDYKKEAWSETWDALFWSFVGKHYEKLQREGRLGFIGVLYGKMSKEKIKTYNTLAEKYLNNF